MYFILCNILVVAIVVAGSAGYMIIEGWDVMDSIFMTIISLSTVGYSEVHELSDAGRIHTILLIVLGVGFFLYMAGVVVQLMVEGQIRKVLGRRKLDKKISGLKGHYIVCGYGRIGKVIYQRISGDVNLRGDLRGNAVQEINGIPRVFQSGISYHFTVTEISHRDPAVGFTAADHEKEQEQEQRKEHCASFDVDRHESPLDCVTEFTCIRANMVLNLNTVTISRQLEMSINHLISNENQGANRESAGAHIAP